MRKAIEGRILIQTFNFLQTFRLGDNIYQTMSAQTEYKNPSE